MLLLLAIACGPVEGDEPGECRDGADNDADGFFDCEDPGCAEDADCLDEPVDSPVDSPADSPVDSGTDSPVDTQADSPSHSERDSDSPMDSELPVDTGPFDLDGDGHWDKDDCEPADISIHPGAAEWLDGVDNNCDGVIDEPTEADDMWRAEGSGWAGRAVELVPDVNGDGVAEALVGGPVGDLAWLLYGPLSGTVDLSTDADLELSGEASGDYAANYLSHGDLDGDGFTDLLVSGSQNDSNAGAFYVVDATTPGSYGLGSSKAVVRGSGSIQLGVGLLGIDQDQDGYDDVLASTYSSGIWVYEGPITSGESVGWKLSSSLSEYDLARAEAVAIDWDGDGVDETALGSYGSSSEGVVQIVSNPGGNNLTLPDDADTTFSGDSYGGFMGLRLAQVGDVDGDGLEDVLAGAFGRSSYDGAAYLFLAGTSSGGVGQASWKVLGEDAMQLGRSVGGGDLDGDGLGDLAVGSYVVDDYAGAVYVFRGSPSGTAALGAADLVVEGSGVNDYVGWDLAGGLDVSGDGDPDLLVGAANYDNIGAGLLLRGD